VPDQDPIAIRRWKDSDSLEVLTDLLHRAYAQHAAEGRVFFAYYQGVDDTRHRISKGECWVAFRGGSLVGTVTIVCPYRPPAGYPASSSAGTFYQLAVLPEERRRGLGTRLLDLAESRLRELGADAAVIDTSCEAAELLMWYQRRGYARAGSWKWEVTNYDSVVLRKELVSPTPEATDTEGR
jgi:ribosomal protein S18 acetylase RimI-like enzyme